MFVTFLGDFDYMQILVRRTDTSLNIVSCRFGILNLRLRICLHHVIEQSAEGDVHCRCRIKRYRHHKTRVKLHFEPVHCSLRLHLRYLTYILVL